MAKKKTKHTAPADLVYEAKPLKLPYDISYSKLSLFDDCPNKFFFKYLCETGIKPIAWSSAVIGTAAHAAVEDWAIAAYGPERRIMSRDEVVGTFLGKYEMELAKAKSESQYKVVRDWDEDKYVECAKNSVIAVTEFLPGYLSRRCGSDEVHLQPEVEISTPFEHDRRANLKGIIDMRCLVGDKVVAFFDLKTTKDSTKWYWVDWEDNIQKTIYEYLMTSESGELPERFGYVVVNYLARTIFAKEHSNDGLADGHFSRLAARVSAIMDFVENPAFVQNHGYAWHRTCEYRDICPMGGFMKK